MSGSPFIISDSDEEIQQNKEYKISPEKITNLSKNTLTNIENKSKEHVSNVAHQDKMILDTLNSALENKVAALNHETSAIADNEKFIGLLILKNLSPLVYFEHLWQLFEPFGELESAAVINKQEKLGVVKFKNAAEAIQAMEILQGIRFFNEPLNIRSAFGDSRNCDKHKAKLRKEKYLKINKDDIISSRFLLATNVFDKSMFLVNPTLSRRLYLDFLNIIGYSKSSIYHIFIDELSDQGAIYMASSNLDDAKLIFKALNGCLYEGRKVLVDCIPEQLYFHLFPTSANISPPLIADSIMSMDSHVPTATLTMPLIYMQHA